jgi:hypothetical protein
MIAIVGSSLPGLLITQSKSYLGARTRRTTPLQRYAIMEFNIRIDQLDLSTIIISLEEAETLERDNGRTMTANMLYGIRQRLILQECRAVEAAVEAAIPRDYLS